MRQHASHGSSAGILGRLAVAVALAFAGHARSRPCEAAPSGPKSVAAGNSAAPRPSSFRGIAPHGPSTGCGGESVGALRYCRRRSRGWFAQEARRVFVEATAAAAPGRREMYLRKGRVLAHVACAQAAAGFLADAIATAHNIKHSYPHTIALDEIILAQIKAGQLDDAIASAYQIEFVPACGTRFRALTKIAVAQAKTGQTEQAPPDIRRGHEGSPSMPRRSRQSRRRR